MPALSIAPPLMPAELPVRVQSISVAVPKFSMPPPLTAAEFAVSVQSVSLTVP